MTDIKQRVSGMIREARIAEGLTQVEAGEKMGVNGATFNRYETGKQNLTIETLDKIAEVLKVSLKITFNK